jgi:hypothetical protein
MPLPVEMGNLPEWLGTIPAWVALAQTMQLKHKQRAQNYGQYLSEESKLDGEAILEKLQASDLLCELVESGLNGAVRSSAEKKQRLFARVVANALNGLGFATPDQYRILLRTVAELEASHVQLLVLFATPTAEATALSGTSFEGALTEDDVLYRWPAAKDAYRPMAAALVREGLVEDVGTQGGYGVPAYRLTRYGCQFLRFLSPDDLRGFSLGSALLTARYEDEGEGPMIVVRNLGLGAANKITTRFDVELNERLVRRSLIEPANLLSGDELRYPVRPPTFDCSPPYEIDLRWSDLDGDKHRTLGVGPYAP